MSDEGASSFDTLEAIDITSNALKRMSRETKGKIIREASRQMKKKTRRMPSEEDKLFITMVRKMVERLKATRFEKVLDQTVDDLAKEVLKEAMSEFIQEMFEGTWEAGAAGVDVSARN